MPGKTRIISAFCLSILLLLLTGVFTYRAAYQLKSSSAWVSHTQKVIADIQALLLSVEDVETAQRGYVITGENKYLMPYQKGLDSIPVTFTRLNGLVSDNASQKKLLDSIFQAVNSKVGFAKHVVEARTTEGFATAQKMVSTDVGENLMKQIRRQEARFVSNERSLLSQRLQSEEDQFSFVLRVIIGSIAVAVAIVLVTLYFFIKDHAKRLRSERQVAENEQRIKKFLESLPVGIYVLSADGTPYYANNKSKQLLGKGIVPGAALSELTQVYKAYTAGTTTLYPAEKRPIVRALRGERDITEEDLEIDRDGVRIPLRINATNITDSLGNIEYAIAVLEDIRDAKEVETRLIEAKRLAEESSMLKEAFLANMSHEIRTPMNAILGFTELLLKKNLGGQERDYVQTIKTSGENLLRIISDVLDVSKMESGMMTFEAHPISIKEIFSSLQSMLSHKAGEKDIALSFTCDPGVPDTVLGDPTRLTQIIVNLVGNAIKFTEKGKVEVSARLLSEQNDTYRIGFHVKDTGIGIPQDKLKTVFERFTQAEAHTTRHYGGTGLGLSIVKQLAELQGGSVSVESKVNLGSVFTCVLPFKKAGDTRNAGAKIKPAIDLDLVRTRKILVVEDNPVNVKFIFSLFGEHQIKADLAENGKIAVDKVRTANYDVVLMDIEMPEMNGYDATKTIRSELKSNVPIIAMTAHAMAGEREKCLAMGMNGYITKPIREELLFESLFNLTVPAASGKSAVPQSNSLINLSFLVKSMRGKKEIIRETIEIFLKQVPEDLSEISTGVQNEDYSAVRRFSHRMKSTIMLMGISEMEAVLQQMEAVAASQTDFNKIKNLYNSLLLLNERVMQEMHVALQEYS